MDGTGHDLELNDFYTAKKEIEYFFLEANLFLNQIFSNNIELVWLT